MRYLWGKALAMFVWIGKWKNEKLWISKVRDVPNPVGKSLSNAILQTWYIVTKKLTLQMHHSRV